MIIVFAMGLFLIALALPVQGDWAILAGNQTRRWFWRFGITLAVFAVVVGDYEPGGLAALAFLAGMLVTAIGLLFWLDGGRFDDDRMRRSMGWYFRDCGPGGWPMGGHRVMAVVMVALLFALLLLRPLARAILGLNAGDLEAAAAVFFF